MPDFIQANNITKTYTSRNSRRTVLESLSFTVPSGQRVAIVGPNGAGKTTLLKIIIGLTAPDSGSIMRPGVNEETVLAYLPQDYRNALFPWLTIKQNVALYLSNHSNDPQVYEPSGIPTIEEIFSHAAKEIGFAVDLNKFPYQLSGGEQQILVILQSLLRRPHWIVADEPFAAIDFHKKELIINYFETYLELEHATIFFVVHDVEDAVLLADRIFVLARNTGLLKADIPVVTTQPRTSEWRYEREFRSILMRATEAFE